MIFVFTACYNNGDIDPNENEPRAMSVILSAERTELYTGEKITLSVEVIGYNNPSQEVIFSSSDSNIVTVNSEGIVRAIRAGSEQIRATSVAYYPYIMIGWIDIKVSNSLIYVGYEFLVCNQDNRISWQNDESIAHSLHLNGTPVTHTFTGSSYSLLNFDFVAGGNVLKIKTDEAQLVNDVFKYFYGIWNFIFLMIQQMIPSFLILQVQAHLFLFSAVWIMQLQHIM